MANGKGEGKIPRRNKNSFHGRVKVPSSSPSPSPSPSPPPSPPPLRTGPTPGLPPPLPSSFCSAIASLSCPNCLSKEGREGGEGHTHTHTHTFTITFLDFKHPCCFAAGGENSTYYCSSCFEGGGEKERQNLGFLISLRVPISDPPFLPPVPSPPSCKQDSMTNLSWKQATNLTDLWAHVSLSLSLLPSQWTVDDGARRIKMLPHNMLTLVLYICLYCMHCIQYCCQKKKDASFPLSVSIARKRTITSRKKAIIRAQYLFLAPTWPTRLFKQLPRLFQKSSPLWKKGLNETLTRGKGKKREEERERVCVFVTWDEKGRQ